MPKGRLTFSDVAKAKENKLKTQCLGVKALKKISWETISDKMGVSRTTLKYRFDNNLLTLSEWLELLHILGIKREETEL